MHFISLSDVQEIKRWQCHEVYIYKLAYTYQAEIS